MNGSGEPRPSRAKSKPSNRPWLGWSLQGAVDRRRIGRIEQRRAVVIRHLLLGAIQRHILRGNGLRCRVEHRARAWGGRISGRRRRVLWLSRLLRQNRMAKGGRQGANGQRNEQSASRAHGRTLPWEVGVRDFSASNEENTSTQLPRHAATVSHLPSPVYFFLPSHAAAPHTIIKPCRTKSLPPRQTPATASRSSSPSGTAL